jgi:hypothetical protein
MKKATGKSNIEILKNYVAGERPFTQVGYEGEKIELKDRKEGDIWEDGKGKKWIKTSYGVRSYNPTADIIKEERDKAWICKKTGKNLKFSHTKYDKIALEKTGMCFDALIEYETELRIKGLYKDYAAKKVFKNQLAYLKDLKQKLEESYKYTDEHKVLTYVNSNGDIDEWSNESRVELMQNIKDDLDKCNKAIEETEVELSKLSHIDI